MSTSSHQASLEILPNEILVGVLAPFSTKELLPLSSVSHRFHLVVARLLHRRLLEVAPLPKNDLILECYHPSAKISTPYFSCKYITTKTKGKSAGADADSPVLSDLQQLYSSFRPGVAEENRRQTRPLVDRDPEDDTVTEDVFLDEGELFSQLCAVTNLVKTGPRRGLFLSMVNVSDGVLRVWREWLARLTDRSSGSVQVSEEDTILWVDTDQSVGVRFRVTPGAAERMPIISGPDDNPPVTYKLEYEELLVRTSKLLLAVEKSAVQEVSHSGKAIVIASM